LSVSDQDLKEHTIFVINQLDPSHPDVTIIRPLLSALGSSMFDSVAVTRYIIGFVWIVLYATTSFQKLTEPHDLLRDVLKVQTSLDASASFDMSAIHNANTDANRAYLRLLMGIVLRSDVETELILNQGLRPHRIGVRTVKSTIQHWPGPVPHRFFRHVAYAGSGIVNRGSSFEAAERYKLWNYTSSYTDQSRLIEDVVKLWDESGTFVETNCQ
jgi:hypothetical protein